MHRILALLCVAACAIGGVVLVRSTSGDEIAERARKVHFSSSVLDTHDDTTQRVVFSKAFQLGSAIQMGMWTSRVCAKVA